MSDVVVLVLINLVGVATGAYVTHALHPVWCRRHRLPYHFDASIYERWRDHGAR